MSVNNAALASLYRDAADHIDRVGLIAGGLVDGGALADGVDIDDCPVCLLGGMGYAYFGDASRGYSKNERNEPDAGIYPEAVLTLGEFLGLDIESRIQSEREFREIEYGFGEAYWDVDEFVASEADEHCYGFSDDPSTHRDVTGRLRELADKLDPPTIASTDALKAAA